MNAVTFRHVTARRLGRWGVCALLLAALLGMLGPQSAWAAPGRQAPVPAGSAAGVGDRLPAVPARSDGAHEREPYAKTAAIKKALRTLARMLRSGTLKDVLNWLEGNGVKHVASAVRKHANAIADHLDKLCKWEELSKRMVQDQLSGLLGGLGVKHSSEAALWITEFIWTVLL